MPDDWSDVLSAPSVAVAPRLLGCYVLREWQGQRLIGKIVETEAYDQTDAASHSYRGETPRTGVMFGPPGHLYVYFTYGMHYCCNVVTGPPGHGAAVLLRALEPVEGEAIMRANRGASAVSGLCNGPAKLCQALAIDRRLNGHDLRTGEVRLLIEPPLDPADIVQTTRIGIRQAADEPWRFYIRGNRHVSRL